MCAVTIYQGQFKALTQCSGKEVSCSCVSVEELRDRDVKLWLFCQNINDGVQRF